MYNVMHFLFFQIMLLTMLLLSITCDLYNTIHTVINLFLTKKCLTVHCNYICGFCFVM